MAGFEHDGKTAHGNIRPSLSFGREQWRKQNPPEKRMLEMIRGGIDEQIALDVCGVSKADARKLAEQIREAKAEGKERVARYEHGRTEAMSRMNGTPKHIAEIRDFAEFRKWKERNGGYDRDAVVESPEVRAAFLPPPEPEPTDKQERPAPLKRYEVIPRIDRDWLRLFAPPRKKDDDAHISVALIRGVVCEHFQITLANMFSNRRYMGVSRPRQIVSYLSRHLTTASFPQIGRMLGGKDHTTVLHGVKRIEFLMASDSEFAEVVNGLRERIIAISKTAKESGDDETPEADEVRSHSQPANMKD